MDPVVAMLEQRSPKVTAEASRRYSFSELIPRHPRPLPACCCGRTSTALDIVILREEVCIVGCLAPACGGMTGRLAAPPAHQAGARWQ